MHNYVTLSLETHIFFARIMKEHSFFLEAGFPCKEDEFIKRADWFREQFEELLSEVVQLADGRISPEILRSDELVTQFTIPAENKTSALSGVPFNTRISAATQRLRPGFRFDNTQRLENTVHQINRRTLELLNGLIEFKEKIFKQVARGDLFTANYPLLIEHVLREAKLYRDMVEDLINNRRITKQHLLNTELFWNQIMMEHALFIRGLLDPCEEELIDTADEFAKNYCELLNEAKSKDAFATEELCCRSLSETLKYRDFKAAGAQGILNNKIRSIIIPLLADHVLRERIIS